MTHWENFSPRPAAIRASAIEIADSSLQIRVPSVSTRWRNDGRTRWVIGPGLAGADRAAVELDDGDRPRPRCP